MIARGIGIFPNTGMCSYHNSNAGIERGSRDWIVSRSDLVDVLQTPEYWLLGGNPPSSQAIKTGSLVDALVTEPDRFELLFDIIDADRYPPRYADKERESGKYLVKRKELPNYMRMAESLRAKRVDEWDGMTLGEMLDGADKQVMAMTFFEACGVKVWLRALIDIVPDANWIADVKTTRAIDLRGWYKQLRWEGLALQAAFYLDVYNAAAQGLPLNDAGHGPAKHFLHAIVSNQRPYQAAIRRPDDAFIAQGRAQYMDALGAYCDALATGRWRGYPDGIETINFSAS